MEKSSFKGSKIVATDVSSKRSLTNIFSFLENISKNSYGSKIDLIAHNRDSFDFPLLLKSLETFSLIDGLKTADLLLLDSQSFCKSGCF